MAVRGQSAPATSAVPNTTSSSDEGVRTLRHPKKGGWPGWRGRPAWRGELCGLRLSPRTRPFSYRLHGEGATLHNAISIAFQGADRERKRTFLPFELVRSIQATRLNYGYTTTRRAGVLAAHDQDTLRDVLRTLQQGRGRQAAWARTPTAPLAPDSFPIPPNLCPHCAARPPFAFEPATAVGR
jgi:hypothetical protein